MVELSNFLFSKYFIYHIQTRIQYRDKFDNKHMLYGEIITNLQDIFYFVLFHIYIHTRSRSHVCLLDNYKEIEKVSIKFKYLDLPKIHYVLIERLNKFVYNSDASMVRKFRRNNEASQKSFRDKETSENCYGLKELNQSTTRDLDLTREKLNCSNYESKSSK